MATMPTPWEIEQARLAREREQNKKAERLRRVLDEGTEQDIADLYLLWDNKQCVMNLMGAIKRLSK